MNRALDAAKLSVQEKGHFYNDIEYQPQSGSIKEKGWWGRHKALGTGLVVGGAAAGGALAAPALARSAGTSAGTSTPGILGGAGTVPLETFPGAAGTAGTAGTVVNNVKKSRDLTSLIPKVAPVDGALVGKTMQPRPPTTNPLQSSPEIMALLTRGIQQMQQTDPLRQSVLDRAQQIVPRR